MLFVACDEQRIGRSPDAAKRSFPNSDRLFYSQAMAANWTSHYCGPRSQNALCAISSELAGVGKTTGCPIRMYFYP